MGVDLSLMPENYAGVSFNLLEMERSRDIWAAIQGSKKEFPCGPIRCFGAYIGDGNQGYGDLRSTPYGDPLTAILAGDLADILFDAELRGNNIWIAAAVIAMPRDKRIFLLWH